jgi:hypothetical protein
VLELTLGLAEAYEITPGTRRWPKASARLLGVTRNLDSAWVTQQARNLALGEGLQRMRFLIRLSAPSDRHGSVPKEVPTTVRGPARHVNSTNRISRDGRYRSP